jgi:Tfp pilus assembly protein PilF
LRRLAQWHAAAALAAAALSWAGSTVAHESQRHRSTAPVRAGIAAADAAQSRHDFAAARAELDRLLAAEPGDLEARLMSANLRLLAGDYAAARADCRYVIEAGALLAGTVCLASAQTGPGSVGRARAMIAAPGEYDDHDEATGELMLWRLLTMADLSSRAGDAKAALAFLERAHAIDPGHEEARTQLAERVLAGGNMERALSLASAPGASPSRLVVRLRAALALGDPRADAWRRELEGMLASDRRRGLPPHLREEGELALHVDGNAESALTFARLNFVTQKDTRDLRLLAASASASSDAHALASLRAWMVETGFEDRVVQGPLDATRQAAAAGR